MIAIRTLLFVALCAAAAACGKQRIDSVILITMESVSPAHVSAGLGAWASTDTSPPELGASFAPAVPRDLDDLASLCMRFSNAFAPSGSAFASLVSLHTGRPAEELGVYCDLDRLDGAPTLAEYLSLRGVRCGAFVARESFTKGCGLERGFETYITTPREAARAERGAAAEAQAWLDSVRLARGDQPVFLWLHLSRARPPFEPPAEALARLTKKADRSLGTLAALAEFANNPASFTSDAREGAAALHAACVLGDAAAASRLLLSSAQTLSDFERTLIIFAGSNGEPRGERGAFGSRRSLTDAALGVPLFVYVRGEGALPRVAGAPVDLMDVTVTIASALGAEAPEGARGADLFTLARSAPRRARAVYAAWENRIFTIRTARERLICNPLAIEPPGWPPRAAASPPPSAEEFFDANADPFTPARERAPSPERTAQLRALVEHERASRRPAAPRPEADPARLQLLSDEGIHEGDGHPPGDPPASACGSKP